MPELAVLSKHVKEYRDKCNESQEDFAENCGISKETLGLIERAKGNPTLETLQKIAAYTGTTVADMLTVSTLPPKEETTSECTILSN